MTPYIRQNLECGTDQNISAGREPCQMGWYDWTGKKYCVGKTILDVGCGMCKGMQTLREVGAEDVWGQDIDDRLKGLDEKLIICQLDQIPNKNYDVVTCYDVIEHVIDDISFFNQLIRIAKETVIITTPNFTRSQAKNHCHCREYTIPQFVNIFVPNELWAASPDGWIHHTLLLKKQDSEITNQEKNFVYIDATRNNLICNFPLNNNISFTHSTVDGNEWPHICGLFDLKSGGLDM
jgi:2-polyprenyl-3-methyl-5-hydroxy-6-metoxy-1,4-benzoquinol methylase